MTSLTHGCLLYNRLFGLNADKVNGCVPYKFKSTRNFIASTLATVGTYPAIRCLNLVKLASNTAYLISRQ